MRNKKLIKEIDKRIEILRRKARHISDLIKPLLIKSYQAGQLSQDEQNTILQHLARVGEIDMDIKCFKRIRKALRK